MDRRGNKIYPWLNRLQNHAGRVLLLSFQLGITASLRFAGLGNYFRLFQYKIFITAVGNVFIYLILQVPATLLLALVQVSILNTKKPTGKTVFRTLAFLPCTTALVSAIIIFKALLTKAMVIMAITWRWTGCNTIFYTAGLQSIGSEIYEAARIDGANAVHQFFKITLPLLQPIILLTTIIFTNGTLQNSTNLRP
jgi:lactose/L-arabinose transport system permease protein